MGYSKSEGLDLHRYNAARLFNVNYADVTPEQRRQAKREACRRMYGGSGKLSVYEVFPGLKDKNE